MTKKKKTREKKGKPEERAKPSKTTQQTAETHVCVVWCGGEAQNPNVST